MSLIDQLGGYEKAKSFVNATSYSINELLMMQRTGLNPKQVEDALLEHRRQHDIYEAGDWIVSTLTTGSRPESMVCKIEFIHNGIVTTTSTCGEIVNFYNSKFKHACAAEIKQGYRE